MKSFKENPPVWIATHIEELVSAAALIFMVLVTSANVIGRYVFRSPIPWAEEFATICLVWLTFIGASVCYKYQAHLGMDFILTRLPERVRRVFQIVIIAILLIFFVFIGYLALSSALTTDKTTNYFKLNYRYLYYSVFLGFLSMAIHSVRFLIMSRKDREQFDRLYVKDEDEQQKEEN